VLICLDSFKGSISSARASKTVAECLRAERADLTFTAIPFADGGEGTVEALLAAKWQPFAFVVRGADGVPVKAQIACRGETAVIELAQVAGLPQSPCTSESALNGSTYGAGELILHAVHAGYSKIVLALGGSSTSDGGTGMLSALGVRFLSPAKEVIAPGATGLLDLSAVDFGPLDSRLTGVNFICATDVENPVLGPRGSAAIFGPQKGASHTDVQTIERALATLVRVTDSSNIAIEPGAGAAGSTAFAAMLALNARLMSGAQFVASATGLEARVLTARAVIVGEGKLDHQTLAGKGPGYLAQLAAATGVPAFAIAGQVELTTDELRLLGIERAFSLKDLAPSIDEAIHHPERYIEQAACKLAETIS
jgi:glycerate kinase